MNVCTCDPTRGQTCPPCADGIDEAELLRDGYDVVDPDAWKQGQDDYERMVFDAA